MPSPRVISVWACLSPFVFRTGRVLAMGTTMKMLRAFLNSDWTDDEET
jgi:hypothetical protein